MITLGADAAQIQWKATWLRVVTRWLLRPRVVQEPSNVPYSRHEDQEARELSQRPNKPDGEARSYGRAAFMPVFNGSYRVPARSAHTHVVKASGLRRVSLVLLAPLPWTTQVWRLPFLTVLSLSERSYQQHSRSLRVLLDRAARRAAGSTLAAGAKNCHGG